MPGNQFQNLAQCRTVEGLGGVDGGLVREGRVRCSVGGSTFMIMKGYRSLATPELLMWALVSFTSKLPIAMAPIALVFLVRETPNGYAFGASLAACYVVGEVVGAAAQGMWLWHDRIRAHLAVSLVVGTTAFAALALVPRAPAPVLIALAFAAGAGPAASPAGLRSMLTTMVSEAEVARALSAEALLAQVVWAVSPALVVLLALRLTSNAPIAVAAISAAVAAALVLRLQPPTLSTAPTTAPQSPWRTVASGWPIYLTSAAAMSLLAAAELLLPALLEFRHLPTGWAGPVLSMFAISAGLGAFCYGLRTWPGSVRTQALILLVLTAGCVALVAVLPGIGIGIALIAAGVFQSGVIVARSLALRQQLPPELHAAAYSVMYAASGVGYGFAAIVSAAVLNHAAPSTAILAAVTITLALTAISALAEWSPTRQPLVSADHR